ncbi:hypothetical protein B0H16DRAFT_119944 [Mycena metata]|uniref:Uncharacterized protein n=1 Tax=Mycena metata TaxID=1033252 RepID=A0AAD7I8R2_9AGAR|nr:hypothetical protein B0H16DRAFT_119944 [Mycena metata]
MRLKSEVLPARLANHPLRRVPSAPSTPSRLGVRASERSPLSPCPCDDEPDDGGVDAEKWRPEHVRGRAVPENALGVLPASKAHVAGEDALLRSSSSKPPAPDSCSVTSSAALGCPRSASRLRCRSRSRSLSLSLPRPRKRPVLLWWMQQRAGGRRRGIWSGHVGQGIEGSGAAWRRCQLWARWAGEGGAGCWRVSGLAGARS